VSIEKLIQHAKELMIELGPCVGIAAAVAALVFLICGWPWGTPRPLRASVGGVLSVSLGFIVGLWWLKVRPHWPPREDQDRLLLILFPTIITVELIAAILVSIPSQEKRRSLEWLAWLPRLVLAGMASRILLYDTSYLKDLSGPGTRLWTPEQTWIILGSLAGALFGVWYLLGWLTQREPGRSVPLAVAAACAGTGIVMMMSGYASGGPLAFPLAGAVVGAIAASFVLKGSINTSGILGLAVVGLFAFLVIGHFFGELTWTNAALLFSAPILCSIPELPSIRRVKPQVRASLGVMLAVIPVAVALALAQQKMVENSSPATSGDSHEPTLEDYTNFGK